MFISAMDTTIVTVALPAISQDLHADTGELQWVVDAFLVCLAGLLLVGSGLADRFGRRLVFVAGLAGFAVTSVLAGLASSPLELIVARVLMGAAGACVLPPALSLMAVMFPPRERPRALGIWAAVGGLAASLGPVVGGLLVGELGWEWVFLVNVPVAIVAVPAGLLLLPESRRPGIPPLDLRGAVLSAVGLGGVVFALIEGVHAGWTSPEVLAVMGAGLAAGVAFVLVERRAEHPLFNLRVLTRVRVATGAFAILCVYSAFLGLLFLVPQYLQYVQERSAVAAGLILLPLGVGMGITGPASARIIRRFGPRWTIFGGLCGMALGGAALLFIATDTPAALVSAGMGLVGLCLALTIVSATAVVMDDLTTGQAGDGAAVNQLARQAGGALGVAIVGSVFAALYSDGITDRLRALPPASRQAAEGSIEGAGRVAARLGGELRTTVIAQADRSFDAAARAGIGVCVGLLLLAGLVGLLGLAPRRRRAGDEGSPASSPVGPDA